MKKLFVGLVTGILAVTTSCALFAGCGGDNGGDVIDSEGNTTLTLWVHVAATNPEGQKYKQCIDEFNAAYKDQKIKARIEYKVQTSNGVGNYDSQLNAALQQNKLPDLITFDAPNAWSYAASGILYPIDDLIDEDIKSDFFEASLEQGVYDGKLYGLPIQESSAGVYYNKKMFETAGVLDEVKDMTADDPWTFSQFKEIAKKVKDANNTDYAIELPIDNSSANGELATYLMYPLIMSAGSKLLSDDGLTATGYLDDDAAIAGFQYIKDLANDGLTSFTPEFNGFYSGKIPMMLSSGWTINIIEQTWGAVYKDRDAWGVLPYPKADDGTAFSATGSWSFGITTRNTSSKEPAAKLLAWLVRPESELSITSATGLIPARYSAIESAEKYTMEGSPEYMLYSQLTKTGKARPGTVAYPEFTSGFSDIIKGLKDTTDVASMVKTKTASLQNGLDKYKR